MGGLSICLTIEQAQLLSRLVDSAARDSYPEKDESIYETRRRKALDAIAKKIDFAIESAAGRKQGAA